MNDGDNSQEYSFKSINEGSLYPYLRKSLSEQEIDFVAATYSELHSIGIDAFVYELAQRINKKPKGIIIVVPRKLPSGPYDRNLSGKSFACNTYADIDFLMLDPWDDRTANRKLHKQSFDRILRYGRFALGLLYCTISSKKHKKIFFLSAMLYDLSYLRLFSKIAISRKYTPIFVLLEEGVGTYMTAEVWRLVNIQPSYSQKKTSLALRIRSNYLILLTAVFNDLLSRFVATEGRLLFHKTNGKLIPNTNMIELYKKVIKCRARFAHRQDQDSRKHALIVTQPYSEESLLSSEFELAFVQELVEVFNRQGIHPIIKPHPAEETGKYDTLRGDKVSVLKKEFPVEEVLLATDLVCVLGLTSSALLNANVLYDIPAISAIDFFLKRSNNRLLLVSGHQFKEMAEGYVHFVSDIAELECFISSMNGNSNKIE